MFLYIKTKGNLCVWQGPKSGRCKGGNNEEGVQKNKILPPLLFRVLYAKKGGRKKSKGNWVRQEKVEKKAFSFFFSSRCVCQHRNARDGKRIRFVDMNNIPLIFFFQKKCAKCQEICFFL